MTMDRSNEQAQQRHDYRVRVKNFGPISEGNIKFRPLTVFVGPSNTGKSYLATMVYALHRYFAENLGEFPYGRHRGIGLPGFARENISDPDIKKDLDAWLTSAEKKGEIPPLSVRVEDEIRSIVEGAKDMATPIEREIVRCFGIETISELIRRPRAQAAEVVVDLHRRDERCHMQYHLGIRRNGFEVTGKVIDSKTPFSDLVRSPEDRMLHRRILSSASIADGRDAFYSRLLGMLVGATRNALNNPLRRRVYYLPADRTGVMHSHKVVVSALVQHAATAGLRPAADVPILSGILADFLEQLIQMAGSHGSRRDSKGEVLASRVEETVLRGGVHIDASDTNYPHFVYRPKDWKAELPLMRSSSMVSDLAPIVLYLRHIVRPGDILIIEEPESHLHPEMQVEVIRCLAEVVRSGIQVIVTTHSEWVLDELANMVLTSQVEESERATLGETTGGLYPHEVGAWLFGRQGTSEGVFVEELKMDGLGLYPSGYDRVAVDQHNRWAKIASKIEVMDECT